MNVMVSDAVTRGLRERISLLEEENRQLKERLGIGDGAQVAIDKARRWFAVSPQAARLLVALVSAPMLRKEAIPEICSPRNWENIELQIINVLICRLRRALEPFGFEIENIWGVGYRIDDPDRAAIRQLLGLGHATEQKEPSRCD